jgi:hypothetical protein
LILPLGPGVAARQPQDYELHGVTSLFAAMEAGSGIRISSCDGVPKPFAWTADADLILGKVRRLSKRISPRTQFAEEETT